MLVYSPSLTNRLRYICDFIGNEVIGSPFELTNNRQDFTAYKGPRINYSEERINASDLWIRPVKLLFEKGISEQQVDCFLSDGYKTLFKSDGDLPFDLFAASFYLISRYEEYLPHTKDLYGRYPYENSIAYKERFLDKPLVNTWLNHFKDRLGKRFPTLTLHKTEFSFLPTYDIDEAYSFKHKQWWRTAGGAVKDLLKGKLDRVNLRRRVIANKTTDPFDSYDWMDSIHHRYVLHPRYFFLVAAKTSKFDKNILPHEKSIQDLIKRHAVRYSIGIHPSWQSSENPELTRSEIDTLENISQQKIISSRQHFIRFNLPDTYRMLIKAGILKDYSMGYGSINGFRASVASPFYWYDLDREETTQLQLFPFCYMDANSFFEQKYSPAQALKEMRYYHKIVRQVNGTLITVWHNTFLGTDDLFAGWRAVYQQFVHEMFSSQNS